eukprot:CAMPEP_0113944586 /NCGR_PEP_ID=MMETSP1339-20121228/34682_1 /TAXON_ID=94617 /ORGANISM="Fibrocapsa japonica" /LENGTH=315 /DNA_ID=CAMNT_0000949837 /DNA_START=63 /DNA_END=1010 /DNA_ORIENTATION=+ /assembly_acc=CAM_ASM_000762
MISSRFRPVSRVIQPIFRSPCTWRCSSSTLAAPVFGIKTTIPSTNLCYNAKSLSTSSKNSPKAMEAAPELSTPVTPAVVDGMPRYPELSAGGVLRGLDYFGTVVFAMGGTITAGGAGMDLLGCSLVGTITAVGGGTVRDLLLGNTPVFWMDETEYIYISLATCVATFFGWQYLQEQGVKDDDKVFLWGDAFGVGAFAVIGCMNGVRKGLAVPICMACGMFTATFGGMIRDVLSRKPPRILHNYADIYATTALIGAGSYLVARGAGGSLGTKITAGVGAAVISRYMAWEHGIRLPSLTFKEEKANFVDEKQKSIAT